MGAHGSTHRLCQQVPRKALRLSHVVYSTRVVRIVGLVGRGLGSGRPIHIVDARLIRTKMSVSFPMMCHTFTNLSSVVRTTKEYGQRNGLGRINGLNRIFIFGLRGALLHNLVKGKTTTLQRVLSISSKDSLFSPRYVTRCFDLFCDGYGAFSGTGVGNLLCGNFTRVRFVFTATTRGFQLVSSGSSMSVLINCNSNTALLRRLGQVNPRF